MTTLKRQKGRTPLQLCHMILDTFVSLSEVRYPLRTLRAAADASDSYTRVYLLLPGGRWTTNDTSSVSGCGAGGMNVYGHRSFDALCTLGLMTKDELERLEDWLRQQDRKIQQDNNLRSLQEAAARIGMVLVPMETAKTAKQQ